MHFFRSWEIKIDSQWTGEVPDVFLGCHGVLLLTNVDHPRKKFLTRRTPIIEKIDPRNPRKWCFFSKKNLIFVSVAGISAGRGAEISDILGGPSNILFLLKRSPGGF